MRRAGRQRRTASACAAAWRMGSETPESPPSFCATCACESAHEQKCRECSEFETRVGGGEDETDEIGSMEKGGRRAGGGQLGGAWLGGAWLKCAWLKCAWLECAWLKCAWLGVRGSVWALTWQGHVEDCTVGAGAGDRRRVHEHRMEKVDIAGTPGRTHKAAGSIATAADPVATAADPVAAAADPVAAAADPVAAAADPVAAAVAGELRPERRTREEGVDALRAYAGRGHREQPCHRMVGAWPEDRRSALRANVSEENDDDEPRVGEVRGEGKVGPGHVAPVVDVPSVGDANGLKRMR